MNLINKILYFFTFTNKIKTFLFIISNFLISFLELIGLSLIIPLLIVIFQPEQSISSSLLKNFSNIVSQNFTPNFIILIIFLIYLFKSFFFILLTNWRLKFMNEILIKVSRNLLNKYMMSEQEFFAKDSGIFLRNVNSETSKVIKSLSASADLLFDITLLLTAIIFLSFVNLKPTIFIFIFLVIFTLIYFFFLKKILLNVSKKNINYSAEALKFLIECFKGYSEIFINNKQNFFIEKYIKKNSLILKYKRYEGIFKVLPRTLLELTVIVLLLFFLFNVSSSDKNINLIFFNLTLYGAVFFRIYPSVGKSVSNLQTIVAFKPSVKLIYKELNRITQNKIFDKNINLKDNFCLEKIEFKNVNFFYNEKEKILKNFNKTIFKNSIIGIAGDSGAGKTSLIHLVSGIIFPNSGEIIINDKIKLRNLINWSAKLGYVSQKPFIINSTIRDNVCLGEDNQNIDHERLNKSYFQAGLDEFINKLDNKDLSYLGDDGNFLSGGQIQRIGIARALYKKPNVLLLDEITSNLDDQVTQEIMNNLLKLKDNRIIFLISHDSKVLNYCDEIISL